jgi:endonuclease VIII
MPEGPSLVLIKENLQKFVGEKVVSAAGNAKFDKEWLNDQVLLTIETFGKQLYLIFEKAVLRIHLLMFGSYSVDEQTKPEKSLRVAIYFEKGNIFFYTCSAKVVDKTYLSEIDWEADVMSPIWNPQRAKEKLKLIPEVMACDALLDQHIFSGVGNIIKNEVLFRIAVQPASLIGTLPANKLDELIAEARNYSYDFLKWKRDFVLKKHWLVHNKSVCPKCGEKLVKNHLGKYHRRCFYCLNDQKLY